MESPLAFLRFAAGRRMARRHLVVLREGTGQPVDTLKRWPRCTLPLAPEPRQDTLGGVIVSGPALQDGRHQVDAPDVVLNEGA